MILAGMAEAVLSVGEMTGLERAAAPDAEALYGLMEKAGLAVARLVGTRFPAAHRILVLAGPGNNGGDGYVAARHLRDSGYDVRILAWGGAKPTAQSAARAFHFWGEAVGTLLPEVDLSADLVIDALFGIGLSRALDAGLEIIFRRLNDRQTPVLAVDMPSGVAGDTGAALGEALRADVTITFHCRKPGHLLLPGRSLCGELVIADIGLNASLPGENPAVCWHNTPSLWATALPRPAVGGHKYDRGHALVLSGPKWRTGAARLAARGALRAGAGLVSIAGEEEALAIHAAHLSSIQLVPAARPEDVDGLLAGEKRYNVLVIGPAAGMTAATKQALAFARRHDRALILDADGLMCFAGEPEILRDILSLSEKTSVLTPHEGEFARLFANAPSVLAAPSKLAKARAAAAATGAILVLKGADSLIASPDGRAAISSNAPPFLASAGAGDVLAGMIAGLIAQGMAGFEAAAAAVWMHGEAARHFGPGLIADDLPDQLPTIWRELLD